MTNPPDFIKLLGLENRVYTLTNFQGEQVVAIPSTDLQHALSEKCKVVCGKDWDDGYGMTWSESKEDSSTHTAFLFGIEPIKPKDCKHEPIYSPLSPEYKCKHCAAIIKPATWEIKS